MKEFEEALVCKCKNERIPEEFNYFGKVIGEWDLDWNDRLNTSTPRRVKGEWIFSWVLDGMAVQDVFIVPSRAERLTDIQPDAAYGTINNFNLHAICYYERLLFLFLFAGSVDSCECNPISGGAFGNASPGE